MSLDNAKKHAAELATACPHKATTAALNGYMNVLFGNPQGDQQNVNWAAVDRNMNMLKSEMNELDSAVAKRQLKGILDGLGDVTTVNDGLAHALGVDGYEVYRRVLVSNLSKFCATHEEAQATVDKYAALGVTVNVFGTPPALYVKSACAQEFGGETIPAGKFLKGVNFQEPDFTDLLQPFWQNPVDPLVIG